MLYEDNTEECDPAKRGYYRWTRVTITVSAGTNTPADIQSPGFRDANPTEYYCPSRSDTLFKPGKSRKGHPDYTKESGTGDRDSSPCRYGCLDDRTEETVNVG